MFFSSGKTMEEVAAEKQAEERRKALDREIEEVSKGDIAELRARRDALKGEVGALQDDLLVAMAREERDPSTHGPERRRLQQRGRDLGTIIGAVENRLRALTQERAEKRADDWNRSPQTARLINHYLEATAERLDTLAALVNSYEAESSNGASVQKLIALPTAEVEALRQFEAYVALVQRRGVKVNMGAWPDSVRARLEVTR